MGFEGVASGIGQGLASAALGGAVSSLLPKPKVPSIPNIQLPPAPTPDTPPNAPLTMSDTAAIQRARANRQINAGPGQTVLTTPKQRRDDGYDVGGAGSSNNLTISRTTLLGK